jgi:hypothetical protein
VKRDALRTLGLQGKLISSAEGGKSNKQHTQPCSDCPMRRDALPGWLGGSTPDEYVRLAHSDHPVNCHVITNQQCAGMAIYRANVVKRCDPPNLVLPKDTVKVFGFPTEFLEHHRKGVGDFALRQREVSKVPSMQQVRRKK